MTYTLKNATIFKDFKFQQLDIVIEEGKIIKIGKDLSFGTIFDFKNKLIAPSFIDVHMHSREPGFTYKGNIKSESLAAAHGGFTTCYMMPNVKPTPAKKEVLESIIDIVKRDAVVEMYQIGSITIDQSGKGEILSDMEEISPYVVGFSDDGNGVENAYTMLRAMEIASYLNKPIISHSEDKSLVNNGVVALGEYGKLHHLPMIDPISEAVEVARNCLLAKRTNCHLHICHLSSIDSLDIIEHYQKLGVKVTCEVTPHQLTLFDTDIKNSNFKMNPPLSRKEDAAILLDGLKRGIISCIATDHAPHAKEEKTKSLLESPFGIIGLETAFPVLYTYLVKKGLLTLEEVLINLSFNPAKVFNIKNHEICIGNDANLVIIDLNQKSIIDEEFFFSQAKNSPYLNKELDSKIIMTIMKGDIVYGK